MSAEAAQNASSRVGWVVEVEGDVTLRRGTGRHKLPVAEFLFAGDEIVTAANSRAKFSFCPTSEHLTIASNSTIVVQAAAIRQSRGVAAARTKGSGCLLPQVALGKRDIDHIGAVAARGTPILLYTGGRISTTRPRFTWSPVPNAEGYSLVLKNSDGRVLWTWEHAGQASEVRLPDNQAELGPGIYTWELTVRANGKVAARQSVNFDVKPRAQLSVAPSQTAASQLELAAAFENADYYSEAAAIYRTLRLQNPGDPRFTRHLLWLYYSAGLYAASNEELQKIKAEK
jgi:phage protein U